MTLKDNSTRSIEAAGRIWRLDSVLGPRPRSKIDTREIHLAIANEICGEATTLHGEELAFLCELTRTSFVEVAAFLPTGRSNVTFWTRGGRPLPRLESFRLKKWFWRKLFPALADELLKGLSVEALFDDAPLLARMKMLASAEKDTLIHRTREINWESQHD